MVHVRHLYRRKLEKFIHSYHFLRWLAFEASRLSRTTVEIFGWLVGGATSDQISARAAPTGPEADILPSITGTPTVGQVLTGHDGTWHHEGTVSYTRKWLRDATPIAGATAATYTLVEADIGKEVSFSVTGTDDLGANTYDSAPVVPIGIAPVNTVLPAITGTPTSTNQQTVSNGTWTGTPAPTYTYQWTRDGVNISGQTTNKYTLTVGDVTKEIAAVVTATNVQGTASASSVAITPAS